MPRRKELFDLQQQIDATIDALEHSLERKLPLSAKLEIHDAVLRSFDLGVSAEKDRHHKAYHAPTPLLPPAPDHLEETKKK